MKILVTKINPTPQNPNANYKAELLEDTSIFEIGFTSYEVIGKLIQKVANNFGNSRKYILEIK